MRLNFIYYFLAQIFSFIIPFIFFSYIFDYDVSKFFTTPYIFIFFIFIVISILSVREIFQIETYLLFIKKYLIKFSLFLGLISFTIINFNLEKNATIIILISFFLGGVFALLISYFISFRNKGSSLNVELKISLTTFIIELILFLWIFAFHIQFIINERIYSSSNVLVFILLTICWFISAILSHQFISIDRYKNIASIFYNYILNYLLLISISYFCTNIILNKGLSVYLIPLTIYVFWAMIVSMYRYASIKGENTDEVKTKLVRATTYADILEKNSFENDGNSKYCIDNEQLRSSEFKKNLKSKYLISYNNLYDFLNENIELNNIDVKDSLIIRSSDIYNIQVLDNNKLKLFINLQEINNIRRINEYLIELNKKVCQGGIVIGKFEPIKFRYKHFLQKYPKYLAQVLYFFDFFWKRVLPKIPILKKIYFFLTRGKKRAISLSEGLGRLFYCGFEVINLKVIDNFIFFIIKKVKSPSKNTNPSYGPLFKMNRIGKNGKIIKVYKFRTMHPYSEYLQKFTFDMNKLEKGGKIKDDFRITTWGKILRKFWLDELPMLYNFIKGDLKLVGVRPLSKHYFSLYPEDVQRLRLNCKPGLIPPFYADLPKTFEEIIDSEVKYIHSYKKNHFSTDLRYFFLASYNILIKRVRSA
ncbi:MAG: sugar transferase [Bacteroidetes bacterium]|nr:sugar transferase [Bacteroidota bacterium]